MNVLKEKINKYGIAILKIKKHNGVYFNHLFRKKNISVTALSKALFSIYVNLVFE